MVLRDLQSIGFDATSWYSAVRWYDACQTFTFRSVPSAGGPVVVTAGSFTCECGGIFRRCGDLT